MTVFNPNQDSKGYGELTSYQKEVVNDNVGKIKNAKDKIGTSLTQVSGVKQEFTVLQDSVSKIGSAYFTADSADDKTHTDAEKKIWSKVKTKVKSLEEEKSGIEKELKILEKYASNYESKISSEIKNLEKLSEKVESLKADPGWGWLNWLLSSSKTTRVRESNVNAEIAEVKASKADLKVKELTGRKDILNNEINTLFLEQMELKNNLDRRLGVARDVRQAITEAKMKYDVLVSKYEVRQDTFYNYKLPAKIKSEDKVKILESLNMLKAEIRTLEDLEKHIGDKQIVVGDEEAQFIRSVTDNLQAIKQTIASESINTRDLISNTVSEQMSFTEKVWNSVSRYFSPERKVMVEGTSEKELKVLEAWDKMMSDEDEQSNVDETIDNRKK